MKCPYCAEEIQDEAIKCKYCGEWLPSGSYYYPVDQKKSNFDSVFSFDIEGSKIIINRLTDGRIVIFKDGDRIQEISKPDSGKMHVVDILGHKLKLKYKDIPSPFGLLLWNSGFYIDIDDKPVEKTSGDPKQSINLASYAFFLFALKEIIALFIYQEPSEKYFGFFLFLILVPLGFLIKKMPIFSSSIGSVYAIFDLITYFTQSIQTGYIDRSMGGFIFWLFIRGGATIILIQGFFAGLELRKLRKKFTERLLTPSISSKPRRRERFFLISVILILIAVGGLIFSSAQYYLNRIEGIAYQLGKMAGYSLWIVILSELTWRLIFKKKKQIRLFLYSILFLGISFYQSFTMLNEVRKAKLAIENISSLAQDFLTGKKIEPQQQSSIGDLEQLTNWFNNYLSNLQKKQQFFQAKLENNLANILTEETLSNHTNLIKAKNQLSYVKLLINNYENSLKQADEEAINQISRLNIDNKLKTQLIEGFNEGKRQRENYFVKYLRIERAFVSELEGLINFLISKKDEFWLIDGQVKFYLQNDADVYNDYFRKIMSLAEQESRLIDEYEQEVLQKSEDLQNLFK